MKLRRRFGRSRGHEGGEIQSLLFARPAFTADAAQAWARAHGYKSRDVDLRPDHVRLRQASPGSFARMRTVPFGHGISAVVGWRS